jgi:hypothetical protein
MIPGSGSDVDTTLPLALSIAAAVLCCNPILGLPAIVLAVQARNAASVGSIDLARKRARWRGARQIAVPRRWPRERPPSSSSSMRGAFAPPCR